MVQERQERQEQGRKVSVGKQQVEFPADNYETAQTAVICNDVQGPKFVRHYQKAVEEDYKRFPLLESMMGNMGPWASWSIEQIENPIQLDDSSSPSVLATAWQQCHRRRR